MCADLMVSVVVPVYNGANYISHCIESILSQTFSSFELILVDDGSTDNSLSICQKYVKMDERVKVIHKINGGVSSARNVGIKNATAKYITFIDSDDEVLPDYLNQLCMIESDLAICGYITKYNQKIVSEVLPDKKVFATRNSDDCTKLYRMNLMYMPWCKLYKRDIIVNNDLNFSEKLKLGEDTMFVADYLRCVSTVAVHDYLGYVYNRWDGFTTLSNKISYDTIDLLSFSREHTMRILNDFSVDAALEVKMNTLSNVSWYFEQLILNQNQLPFRNMKKILRHFLENKYVQETLKDVSEYYSSKKVIDIIGNGNVNQILRNFTKMYRNEKYKLIKRKIRGIIE